MTDLDETALAAVAETISLFESREVCKDFNRCFGDGRCGCRKVAQYAITAYLAALPVG